MDKGNHRLVIVLFDMWKYFERTRCSQITFMQDKLSNLSTGFRKKTKFIELHDVHAWNLKKYAG